MRYSSHLEGAEFHFTLTSGGGGGPLNYCRTHSRGIKSLWALSSVHLRKRQYVIAFHFDLQICMFFCTAVFLRVLNATEVIHHCLCCLWQQCHFTSSDWREMTVSCLFLQGQYLGIWLWIEVLLGFIQYARQSFIHRMEVFPFSWLPYLPETPASWLQQLSPGFCESVVNKQVRLVETGSEPIISDFPQCHLLNRLSFPFRSICIF